MLCIPYSSTAQKQRAYEATLLPGIVRVARAARPGRGGLTPREIHERVRTGRYVRIDGPRDCLIPVEQVLREGGDCDNWAAVQLVMAWESGIPVRLVTAGSTRDAYEHIYVEMFDSGRWVASNPKGSQQGMDYGQHPPYSVYRRWAIVGDDVQLVPDSLVNATPVDVPPAGSGCDCQIKGSAADPDPVIRTVKDAELWLTAEQNKAYLNSYGGSTSKARLQVVQALLGGYHGLTRSQMLARIGVVVQQKAQTAAAKLGGDDFGIVQAADAYLQDLSEVKTLADVNRIMASRWATEMLEAGTQQGMRIAELRRFAIAVGGNPNATDKQLAQVATLALQQQANALGVLVEDWINEHKRQYQAFGVEPDPRKVYNELLKRGHVVRAVQGSGADALQVFARGLESLFRNPGDWFRNVVKEIGKGAHQLAENLLDAERNIPFLKQFFTAPLGFHAQAVLLQELANVLIEYRTSAFDSKRVGRATADVLVAAGQALIAASPFLPPPWNVAAAAVGALSMVAGSFVHDAIDNAEGKGPLHQQPVAVMVDQYGRQVDAQGLPLDPYQRQLELQRRQQALLPDRAAQVENEWRRGNDGLWYGWHKHGSANWWWTALAVDQANIITAAWVETTQGWVQL